jgi:hypothetical protein
LDVACLSECVVEAGLRLLSTTVISLGTFHNCLVVLCLEISALNQVTTAIVRGSYPFLHLLDRFRERINIISESLKIGH